MSPLLFRCHDEATNFTSYIQPFKKENIVLFPARRALWQNTNYRLNDRVQSNSKVAITGRVIDDLFVITLGSAGISVFFFFANKERENIIHHE